MLPDRVSNPGPLTYETGALPPLLLTYPVRTTRPDKCDIFGDSIISLNQLRQNSINTAYFFLTFRNHVKIFLSQNILQNVLNAVYCKNSKY